MKKILLSSVTLCFAFFACQSIMAQNQNTSAPPLLLCGNTPEYLELQKKLDPGLEARMAKIEADMQAWIENNKKNPKPHAVVYIPVVFHILYNTASQNISDANINLQMGVLNQTLRKLNTDWNNTPTAFKSLVADCELQFCLASKDPNGNPTNGIIHKSTTKTQFQGTNADIMQSSQGGDDAWNTAKYLNIWVGRLAGIGGFGTYPGGANPNFDGVLLNYTMLPGAPVEPNFDSGKCATHEVGHYFNLYHLWGNGANNSGCTSAADDGVADTPLQKTANYGLSSCPSFPYHANACPSTPNGDMFMNFMDYTNDNCRVMFSEGQKTRMWAALNGPRAGLLNSAVTNCAAAGTNDLIALNDRVFIYPNPSTGDVFMNVDLPNIDILDVTLYNTIGETVLSKKIVAVSGKEIKFDINSKPNGIYLMQVKTPEGSTLTRKIVLNK